ncbi:MAG: M55 family metallopeptidase [Candidatus Thorarchaeota archaeon]
MKILIWCDIEGISGIDDPDTGFNDEKYKHLATAEINAVIRGLKKGGATEIDIFDGHGMGNNLILDDLDESAKYLGGGWMYTLADLIRSEKLKSYNAMVLIGLHAQEGVKDGFIAHTNSGFTALKLNGKPIGEIQQAIWLLGYFGVPTLLVSGDEAAIKETEHYFSDIATVSVKKKEGDRFVCFPLEEIYTQLEEKTFERVTNLLNIITHNLSGSIKVEILYSYSKLADNMIIFPGYEKRDERTVIYEAKDYLEAFWAYHGFRIVLTDVMKEFCNRILKRVEKEFKLEDEESYKEIRKKVFEEMLEERIQFPELEF